MYNKHIIATSQHNISLRKVYIHPVYLGYIYQNVISKCQSYLVFCMLVPLDMNRMLPCPFQDNSSSNLFSIIFFMRQSTNLGHFLLGLISTIFLSFLTHLLRLLVPVLLLQWLYDRSLFSKLTISTSRLKRFFILSRIGCITRQINSRHLLI